MAKYNLFVICLVGLKLNFPQPFCPLIGLFAVPCLSRHGSHDRETLDDNVTYCYALFAAHLRRKGSMLAITKAILDYVLLMERCCLCCEFDGSLLFVLCVRCITAVCVASWVNAAVCAVRTMDRCCLCCDSDGSLPFVL